MEIGSRQILHHNVTAHPVGMDGAATPGSPARRSSVRFVIHGRDRIFSADVDESLTNLGIRVLRTPVQAAKASTVCERLGGSLRRECLEFLIPFDGRHLQNYSGLDHAL